MDELPDLRSDADVDALMARIRLHLEPPPAPAASVVQPPAPAAGDGAETPWASLVAAHQELASTMIRALHAVADTLDEMQAAWDRPAAPAVTPDLLPPAPRTSSRVQTHERTRAATSKRKAGSRTRRPTP